MKIANIQTNSIHYSNNTISSLPNTIPTKGMPTLPYDELINEIKNVAIKLATTTNDKEKTSLTTKRNQLFAMYVSPASPDRNRLFHEAKNVLKTASNKRNKGEEYNLNLIDYLNKRDGYVSFATKYNGYLPSGARIESAYDCGTGDYSYTISQNGMDIMTIGSRGINYSLTPAESIKKDEFYSIYWKAYHSVNNDNKFELYI